MGQHQESAAGRGRVAAAVDWLVAAIPEVACSVATSDANFQSPDDFWSDAANVETCLAYQDRFASGMDDKVRAAHLIAFYSHQLSLVAGAIYLASGLVASVSGLRFETYLRPFDGRTLAAGRFHFFVKLSPGENKGEAARSFHDVFVAQLKPVIALVKQRCGLSARAQWRLAADGLAGAFLEIGRRRGEEDAATEQALAIVKRAHSPLASPELHFEKIVAEAPHARTYRMRGGCCLYYRTDAGDFCDACVLLDPEVRRERLRAHLLDRRHSSP
ncbi:IucA/IucC family C-terminal-domain containing protein [Sinorhizobium fredii]|uniref:IucA/IucC family C-terminal-domain containing protein n=1 Tax=Rhizobium fredii TaxID=380 RepID=UPI001F0A6BD5|nr:IucA/IucC family C-terminal-domain containing protein [Sinorhizobium fredii]